MNKMRSILETTANRVVKIIGAIIFSVLFFYALRYTHYMIPLEIERTEIQKDNIWLNLLSIALFLLLLAVLKYCDTRLNEKIKRILSAASALLCMAFIATAGFWWINSANRIPEADQAFLYGGASYFIDGQYSFLNPNGGYFGMYPYQLPLVALMEGLFRIVGQLNYHAYQTLNVCFTIGVVLLGWLFVRETSKSLTTSVTYALLMANCFPLFFYTNWVYGEIPCLFFTFLAAWALLKFSKTGKAGWLTGVVAGLTMAVVTKKNALILVVAFCLVGLVYAICKKNIPILIAIAATILCPTLIYSGVFKMYEVRSGFEHSEGMPSSLFFELGLHESSGRYGWDDMSALTLSAETGYDWEKADEIAKERIAADLERFREEPSYAALFFREKILSQWNNPLYQCLYFSANYREETMPEEGTFVYKISHDYFFSIVTYSNYIQLLIFSGTIFYFLFAVRSKSNILQHFFAVALIGGFLFCIIWEAKGRYMFPYYISMFPLAVIGYSKLAEYIKIPQHR